MRYAVRISDNEGWAWVTFGLYKGFYGLVWICAYGDLCDVDIALYHSQEAEVFFRSGFSRRGKLCHGRSRRCLRHLSACIGVDLRIQNEQVDVDSTCQDVVQTSVPNIVSPSVTSKTPDRFAYKIVRYPQQLFAVIAFAFCALVFELVHAGSLLFNGFLLRLIGQCSRSDFFSRLFINTACFSRLIQQGQSTFFEFVNRQSHPHCKLGAILKEAVTPYRSPAVGSFGIWSCWKIAAINRGTACCVSNHSPVTEKLSQQLNIGCFAAAGTGAGIFKQRLDELAAFNGIGFEKFWGRVRDRKAVFIIVTFL